MYILGINAYHADSSAALIKDGEVICAVEEERFNRIKHWSGFPSNAIKFCIEKESLEINDLDHITVNSSSRSNLFNKFKYTISNTISPKFILNQIKRRQKKNNIKNEIEIFFKIKNIKPKISYIDHHLSHISSSIFCSSFDNSSVISIDGFGDFSSCYIGEYKNNSFKLFNKILYPHSAGILYQALTQYMGFKNYGDEYKVMGLSAYGKNDLKNKLSETVFLKNDGSFSLDLKYFTHQKKIIDSNWIDGTPKFYNLYDEKNLENLLGFPGRKKNEILDEKYINLAFATQSLYEDIFFNLLNNLNNNSKSKNLSLSGGCSLNSLANGKIYNNFDFKNIYMPPASGDAGGAIGSALYKYFEIFKTKNKKSILVNPYLGPSFNDTYIKNIINLNKNKLNKYKINYFNKENLIKIIAKQISNGKVIGWFQGKMEFGPRALGNRSILCDPRNPNMKSILNDKIKRRESFRPFAPSILREEVSNWFEVDDDVPFMMKIFKFKDNKRSLVPAVVHVDGTGRLQTVSDKNNELYYKLIKEFYYITNIPMILNTSFNENEPIVCRPEEALDCFIRTNMDIVVLENYVISRT